MPPIRGRHAAPRAQKSRAEERPGPEEIPAEDRSGDIDLDDDSDEEMEAATASTALTSLPASTLHEGMASQRQRILERLSGSVRSDADLVGLEEQSYTLRQTLESTVKRGESNSVLLVGPRGSGKSAVSGQWHFVLTIYFQTWAHSLLPPLLLCTEDPQCELGHDRDAPFISPCPYLRSTMRDRQSGDARTSQAAHSIGCAQRQR